MKKILSLLSIALILNNIFLFNVFAAVQIDFSLFTIKVNNGNAISGDIEVYPGDKLSLLMSGVNAGDAITNPKYDFTFSNSNFSYDPSRLVTYLNSTVVNQNISTSIFNLGTLNSLPISGSAVTGDYLESYYLDLTINDDISENFLTITSSISSDTATSNQISRNVFINSNPHIIDYYYEKSGTKVTQLVRAGVENIDLTVSIKDYNGCLDIDNSIVKVDLSGLGLTANESLIFDSCTSNIAKYKKAGITTLVFPSTVTLAYSDFSVTDDSGNSNKPDDSLTSFDNEDKKTDLILEIVSAGTPEVTINIIDDNIGGITNTGSNIEFSGNQNGNYKINLGVDNSCTTGTTLSNWLAYVSGNTGIYNIDSGNLTEGLNTLTACLLNDELLTGSFNFNITKDTVNPIISEVSVGPVNVVLENTIAHFTCSENGNYIVEKGGSGVLNSGTILGAGSVLSSINNDFTIINSNIDVNSNDFYLYCFDEAENYISEKITVNKTTIPPSFIGGVTNFSDNDIDYNGLDGRDISIFWNNSLGINYDFFESYRIYIIPSNTILDEVNNSYVYLDTNISSNSFTGTLSLTKDSLGNNLLSNSEYKACITIMGTNGILGTPGCNTTTLVGDIVSNAIVTGAKFTSDTNLEITTDTTLDTNAANHDSSLISYTVNSSSFTGVSITSIDGNKININIASLGDLSINGSNLLLGTGALRASAGGFNDDQSFTTITDGQTPVISSFSNNTSSSFNNFFTGGINIGYTFSEDMKLTDTKFEIIRTSGNLDSTEHIIYIIGNDLILGAKTVDLDLDSLSLVDGANYQIRLVGKDLAGNYVSTNYITNIKYDLVGPDKIIQNITSLYSTLIPELTWNIPLDNDGNGSGIKEYKLDIFNGNDCSGTSNQTHTIGTNSKIINTVGNIADYSWKVTATDNMLNVGTVSDCNNFRVDTTVPIYTNFQIEDKVLNSTFFVKQSNLIEITSTITDTDIDHIWIDISMLTGTGSNSNELCSTPSTGIICTYIGTLVTYSFSAGNSISDGVKQVMFNSQNTSGGNDVTKIISITSDSNSPIITTGAILTPSLVVGGTGTTVTWDTSKINDTIGLDYLQIEYSTGAGLWNIIGTGSNIGSIDWGLTSIASGLDYKVKLIAIDGAGNTSSLESGIFEVDRTNPTVPSNTITNSNGGEIFGGIGTEILTWNSGSITDTLIASNPINLYYTIDSGTNWILIDDNLSNSGSFSWTHGVINSETVLIKLTAFDQVGNFTSDVSDASFIIDTINPTLAFDFSSTPVNGSYINNNGFDILANTGDAHFLDSTYSLLDLTTGKYFNGTSFTGTVEINNNICSDPTVKGTNNSCDLISFTLTSSINNGDNYRLQLKSTDEAGNVALSIPLDYIGDIINPNLVVSTASGTYFKDSINIEGTSSDLGSGISSVKIQIKKGTDYWNGTDFVAGIQTLNTTTSDNYSNWTYDFSYNGADQEYEVKIITYDKSYKVNNTSEEIITIIKDSTIPSIIGGTGLFTSPLLSDIYIGGDFINVLWNSGSITDIGSGLATNPITLEYFDGTNWVVFSNNQLNDGSVVWASESLDLTNVKIRLSVIDNVGNIAYQSTDTFIIDSTNPTISSIETMDLDANGEIDALNIVMSENIQDSSIVLGDFTISNLIGNPTSFETGNSTNDNIFILKFTNIGDTSLRPSISYTKGSLLDIAGKFLQTDNYTLSIDKASPRLLTTEIFDTDGNGKLDKIEANFSEDISSTTDISAWSIDNILNGISIDSVSVSGNTANITLIEGIDFNTSVGSMAININSNSNWEDLNNNQAGSIVSGVIGDKAKPIVYKAEYFDIDSDYKVDKVDITFSENLLQFSENDFTILGLIKSTGSISNNIISFNITETNSDNDTGTSSSFSFTSGNLKDSSGNFSDNITNQNIDDKVNPKLLTKVTSDNDGNGKIDSIILTYSESLNSDFSTFVGEVDSYSLSLYSKGSTDELVLNVTEKNEYDSNETPLVRILSNNSFTDSNGNFVEQFSFIATTDNVGPVIIGARYDEDNHKIFISSSETLESTDFLTGNFILNNAGGYSITGVNFAENSITLAGETISFGSTEIAFKTNSIGDTLGNKQIVEYFTKISPPIIINEIMLSNNSSDNYIELRNLSANIVDISNYTIAGVTVPSTTNIAANGYYLISKDSTINSIINVVPDLIDTNLDISGTSLTLNNGVLDVDFASLTTGLFDTATPKSVERKIEVGNGLLTSSWYTAQDSIGFNDLSSFGTPGSVNVYDPIAPTISSYNPSDNILLPAGNLMISMEYTDNVGGLGIDITTNTLSLVKWNGSIWGADISATYVDFAGKTITSTNSNYTVSGLPFGKYKIDFSVSDKAGNSVNKIIIFYIDEFTFNLNTNSIDIGDLISGFNTFSANEAIITIETVGAGFDLDMIKSGLFTNNGTDIIDFDGNYGFGFDQDNGGYSGIITSMGNSVNINTKAQDINLDGNKNTFTYKIKYGAKVDIIQGAGHYDTNPIFNITTSY